jgi:hypothetical protein
MSQSHETDEAHSQNVKVNRKVLFSVWGAVALCLGLLFALTNLGYYKACGSDTSIDANSARLRERSFFLGIKWNEEVHDSGVSLTLASAGISPLGPPDWKLMHRTSWPVKLHGQPAYGKASVSLTQASQLLNEGYLASADKERLAVAFVDSLSHADFDGLRQLIRRELQGSDPVAPK